LSYVVFTSVVALLYAGALLFSTSSLAHDLVTAPGVYVIINGSLIAVYLADTVQRHRLQSRQREAMGESASRAAGALATDFAGFAVLSSISTILAWLVQAGVPPIVSLDLHRAFALDLPVPVQNLQGINLVLAFGATAVALFFTGLAAIQTITAERVVATDTGPIAREGNLLRWVTATAVDEVTRSLRFVLGPLAWIGVGLSLGVLAQQIADYFQSSAPSRQVIDLFNPFSVHSQARYGQGLLSLLLGGIALVAVILAVAATEHDERVLIQALALLRGAALAVCLGLAFFTFSLAATNVLAIYLGVTALEPFQVGAFTLLALVASGVLAIPARRPRTRQSMLT